MSGAGEAQIIKKIGGKEEVRSFLEDVYKRQALSGLRKKSIR